MIEDNVQHHANSVFMRGLHHVTQIVVGAEMWINVKKILDAVAVVAVIGIHLLEHRAEPDGGDAHPAEISQLLREPAQISADKISAGIAPRCCIGCIPDGIARIRGGEYRRAAESHRRSIYIEEVIFLSVRKSVHQHEVENFIFPVWWRRKIRRIVVADELLQNKIADPLQCHGRASACLVTANAVSVSPESDLST